MGVKLTFFSFCLSKYKNACTPELDVRCWGYLLSAELVKG